MAVVARELAYTKGDRRCIALQADPGDAERAAMLRDALVTDTAQYQPWGACSPSSLS